MYYNTQYEGQLKIGMIVNRVITPDIVGIIVGIHELTSNIRDPDRTGHRKVVLTWFFTVQWADGIANERYYRENELRQVVI